MGHLLTIDEAGEALRVGRSSVYVLIQRGQLEKVNLGRKSLVTRRSVEQLVAKLHERGKVPMA